MNTSSRAADQGGTPRPTDARRREMFDATRALAAEQLHGRGFAAWVLGYLLGITERDLRHVALDAVASVVDDLEAERGAEASPWFAPAPEDPEAPAPALVPVATAQVVSEPHHGDFELMVFEGSVPPSGGEAPVLRLPIEVDPDTLTVVTDVDALLAEHGWRAVPTPAPEGVAPQPGIWTPTSFGAVASLARCEP